MHRDQMAEEIEALHGASFAWTLTCCGGRREEAQDVLQTTYLKILEGKARWGGTSSFKTWLFAVIRRTAAGQMRRQRWRQVLLGRWAADGSGESPAATPEDELRDRERRRQVRRALGALSRRQRQVLELVFYHEMSIRQAAEVLGIGLGSARVHYERGKKALGRALDQEDGDGI